MGLAWTVEIAFAVGLVLGLGLGLGVGLAWSLLHRRQFRRLLEEAETQRQHETDTLLDGVKLAFADISAETFRRAGDDVMKLAQSTLSAERRGQAQAFAVERAEFESRLNHVLQQLERMQGLIRELERDRAGKFNELAAQLKSASEGAEALTRTTQKLADALVNARARGQWGERMAEDVLRALGMKEHINYRRQSATGQGRPDFTFLLPEDRVLHMDVKFPFDNYARSLEAEDAAARSRYEAAFIRDVRQRIAEVGSRDYVAPEAGTRDLALLFIPNEQLFVRIFELEPGLLDEAMAKGVLMVSPVTLFAVLAILRRAVELFHLEAASREILETVQGFKEAWRAYHREVELTERRLEQAMEHLRQLTGARRRALDKKLARIDAIAAGEDAANAAEAGEDAANAAATGEDAAGAAASDQDADAAGDQRAKSESLSAGSGPTTA